MKPLTVIFTFLIYGYFVSGYATSCKEFKKLTTIRKDGDYQLKLGDQLVKVSVDFAPSGQVCFRALF